MHGVAPRMCGQVVRPLLGGGAGGRPPGFIFKPPEILLIFRRLSERGKVRRRMAVTIRGETDDVTPDSGAPA